MKKLIVSMVPLCLLSVAVLGFSIPAPAASTHQDIGFNRSTVPNGTDIATAHVMLAGAFTPAGIALPGESLGNSYVTSDFAKPHRPNRDLPTSTPEPSLLALLGLGLAGLALTRTRVFTNPS